MASPEFHAEMVRLAAENERLRAEMKHRPDLCSEFLGHETCGCGKENDHDG